ncbi:MAG: flagellar hook-length control protein FliK [Nitrospirae bacterium]|nr:flagellar hook-length control protein FliK [Nitrospirota bacterium]
MNINSDNSAAGKGDNVIVLARPDGKPISLVSGDTVNAEVIDVIGSDLVALRISPPAGKGEDAQGTVLVARTNVPLSEGDQIALQVQGGDNEVSLKYLGKIAMPEPPPSQAPTAAAEPVSLQPPAPAAADIIQQKIQLLLSGLVDARLTSSDFQDLQKVLDNIPASVKNQYPEFNTLSSLVPNIEQLNAQTLQASVESSGIMLETNIKQSALQALNNAPDVVMAKQVLNSIVQKAVDAFQYPQSQGHTRSFLSDLIAVMYKGIQALNSNNASDTLNLLKQAIADCLTIVEQDKTQHQSCNCDDVLTSVRQKLDEAIAALSSPKDTATAVENPPKDGLIAIPEQGRPQRGIMEGGEALTAVRQKIEEAAATLSSPKDTATAIENSPKDGLPAMPQQGSPQRGIMEGGEVLTAVRQKFEEAVSTLTSPKDSAAITTHIPQKDEHVRAALDIDSKALLLKIRDILQDDKMTDALKYSPAKRDDLVGVVDKFIKNIEYFQLTSRANDMVYTYLPFLWNELKDGELLFKKNKYHAKKSFTCDINLDLDRLGKISVSVTAADGGFYVSFNAEKEKTKQLILENKGELEKGFVTNGLFLKIINVGQKGKLDFAAAKTTTGGLDLRI